MDDLINDICPKTGIDRATEGSAVPRRGDARGNGGVKDPVSGFSHFVGLVVAIIAVSFLLGTI